MKKNFFFMAALLVAMVGCNKEPQEEGNGLSASDKVYMSFSIKTPTTRSATENDGTSNATPDTEVGKDYENNISEVDIVLTNDSGAYIVADNVQTSGSVGTNKYIASFSSLELMANTAYKVYIYANCEAPESKDLNATSDVGIEEMTRANHFWMTNAYEAKSVTMPEHMSAHTSPASPLNLGAHSVERCMARFDYNKHNGGEFWIDNHKTLITIHDAAIINHSTDFYMLRRTSADGTNANWVVGGIETPDNYVVDTDYENKLLGVNAKTVIRVKKGEEFKSWMQYPETWVWKPLPPFNGNVNDNWTEEGTNEDDTNQYYIWEYCKENTIPGTEVQEKGHTTGIVFRGDIWSEDAQIQEAMLARKTIYVFENVLYGSWEMMKAAASAENAPTTLVYAISQTESRLQYIEDNKETYGEQDYEREIKEAYAKNGFSGFSPDTDGNYFTYYYYWIRHNDNGDNAVMGPMEFAVVRNNVYKLRIDGVYKYGHPLPGPDPDPSPEDPYDPDESLNYYFNVTVDVLPWTVRVNNIEF